MDSVPLNFVFRVIALRGLAAELFENHAEVAIAVLSALMESTASAVERKLRLFRRIIESNYAAALKELLTVLVQQYLKLTPEEEVEMSKLMAEPQNQPVVEFISSWRREGREEGRQEGRQEGRTEALRESVLRLLEARFGEIPEATARRVAAIPSAEELDVLFRQALTATSLDDLTL